MTDLMDTLIQGNAPEPWRPEAIVTWEKPGYPDTLRIELGDRPVHREPGDICVTVQAALDLPIICAILIRADGRIEEWYAKWGEGPGYWHFGHGSDERALGIPEGPFKKAGRAPTAGQTEAIARIRLKQARPFGLTISPGAPVCDWAFAGMTFEAVMARFGEGRKGYRSGS